MQGTLTPYPLRRLPRFPNVIFAASSEGGVKAQVKISENICNIPENGIIMLTMPWNVNFSKKAAKQHEKMPKAIQAAVALLMTEMRGFGTGAR